MRASSSRRRGLGGLALTTGLRFGFQAARLGLGFGLLARLGLAALGVGQRGGAGGALLLAQRAQHDAGRPRGRAGCHGGGRGRGGTRRGGRDRREPAQVPSTRRFTVSTMTCFVRPWEKLWRTMPCSIGRFSDSGLRGDRSGILSPGLFRIAHTA